MRAPLHSLLISARGLDAWRLARDGDGDSVCAQTFAAGEDAPERLRDWLGGARRRCLIVADVIDERHAVEYLPHAARAVRRVLIRRRLARHFPETALTGALALPKDTPEGGPKDGRRDPVLLTALTRPALITPWLAALGEAAARGGIEVRGFTSVPFLLERWYRRQRALPAQCLLLAPVADGMRQLFFRRRRLLFSRLIPARAAALVACLPAYRDELAQTLAWLAAQRLSDGSPPIRILAAAADRAALRELIPAGGDADFISPAAPSGTRDGTRDGAQDSGKSGSVQAVTHLLLREARRAGTPWHYDDPRLRNLQRLATVRRAMIAATAAIVVAVTTTAAVDLVAIHHLRHETGQAEARRLTMENEIGKLEANTGDTASSEALATWLDRAERLVHAPGIAPAAVLDITADLLAAAPWARLDSLAWNAPDGDGPAQDASASADAVVHMTIALDDTAPPPRAAADALAAHWRHRHGMPARVFVDANGARLRFDAAFKLPAIPATSRETAP
ncbi:MAG: hypothetical protein LBP86_02805 [Azoarcus sp.]|nr:hypothetical protein [Azoarcus sp.]